MNWRIKPLADAFASAEKKPLKRTLGPLQLTLLGVGSVIGTGIFVLSAEAAQKAGPGMTIAFILAAVACALTALCYAELAAMVPLSGSAYTYSYVVLGEFIAWMVGWALILEYAVAASAVSVGWSNYFVGLVERSFQVDIPDMLTRGPHVGGLINLPAGGIGLLMTGLLVVGTRSSATVNACLVTIKVAALVLFVVLALPLMTRDNFEPFLPNVVTLITGAGVTVFASLFPVGVLADISNSGTLFAFMAVALGVLILRRRAPNLVRPFRTPALWIVGPLALASCGFLFLSLPRQATLLFSVWTLAGLVVYALYGYRKSPLSPVLRTPG
jgi:amino acid transporter